MFVFAFIINIAIYVVAVILAAALGSWIVEGLGFYEAWEWSLFIFIGAALFKAYDALSNLVRDELT